LSEEKFKKDLLKKLAALSINEGAINSNPKLKKLFDDVLSRYVSLIGRVNALKQIVVWKLSDQHYHFMADEYDSRTKQVSELIQAATERNGTVNVSGAMRNIGQ